MKDLLAIDTKKFITLYETSDSSGGGSPPTMNYEGHLDSSMRGPGVIINEGQYRHYSTRIGHYGMMKIRNDHVILSNQVEVLIILSSLISYAEAVIILTIIIKKVTRYFDFQEDSVVWD